MKVAWQILAHMGERRIASKTRSENLKGRKHLGGQDVDGKIIVEWILEKNDGNVRTGPTWLIRTKGKYL
jgi:hypothetical protein